MSIVTMRFPQSLRAVRRCASSGVVSSNVAYPDNGSLPIDPVREDARRAAEQAAAQQARDEAVAAFGRKLEESLEGIDATIAQQFDAARDWVLEFALSLAGQIIGAEVEAGRYELGAMIREQLVQILDGDGSLSLHVCPQDEASAHGIVNGLADGHRDVSRIRVLVDAELQRGECNAQSAAGGFRSDPALALARAQEAIRGAFA